MERHGEDAECAHDVPSAHGEFRAVLGELTDWDSAIWLAERLVQSPQLHQAWLALTAGRIMELKGDMPEGKCRESLQLLASHCDFNSFIPFTGLFLRMAGNDQADAK